MMEGWSLLVHTEGEGLVLWRVGAHVFRRYGCGCVKGEGKWQIEVGFRLGCNGGARIACKY